MGLFTPDRASHCGIPADQQLLHIPEDMLRNALAEKIGVARYELWFGEGTRLGVDGDALHIQVPTRFFQNWIQSHYTQTLIEIAEGLAGRPLRIDFHIASEAEPMREDVIRPSAPTTPEQRPRSGETAPQASPPLPSPSRFPSPSRPNSSLEASSQPAPDWNIVPAARRLDTFVVGPCSRLAHAAALEMVRTLGTVFNPLLIHGAVGLGKTHLLEGIAYGIRTKQPRMQVVQVSAESFTNAFLDAMRQGGLSSFRSRFRRADALIVDDIHFLTGKRATQDEFLHTFNAVSSRGRVVVLSADQHPRLIPRLSEELITRFLGGMVVRLDAPDLATRRAIAGNKASARGIEIPEAVLDFVAESLRSSVRELEGAVHTLLATASLTGKPLDLGLARFALRDIVRHTTQAFALKDVERAVCKLFQIEPDLLRSDSRARVVSQPRMLAMYLARKYTGAAYGEIGRYFGGRNHSTVLAAERKVRSWLAEDLRCGTLPGFETISDVLATLEQHLGG